MNIIKREYVKLKEFQDRIECLNYQLELADNYAVVVDGINKLRFDLIFDEDEESIVRIDSFTTNIKHDSRRCAKIYHEITDDKVMLSCNVNDKQISTPNDTSINDFYYSDDFYYNVFLL